MYKTIKKIYTIIILIKNIIFRKKHYTLKFVAEQDGVLKRWYYDFKHWGFSHGNLEMVSGADKLCEQYANGSNEVIIDIIASKRFDPNIGEEYDWYEGDEQSEKLFDRLIEGRNYKNKKAFVENGVESKISTHFWICPVTLFVLGRYPNYLWIKKHGN